MTLACEIVTVVAPANITATRMVMDKTYCTEPCAVNVTVDWTNIGDVEGSFVPNISVNGVTMTPVFPAETVPAGATVTHTFALTGLSKAVRTICPVPN